MALTSKWILIENFVNLLSWLLLFRFELDYFGQGVHGFRRNRCLVDDCFITRNRSLMPVDQFDAIIFNLPTLSSVTFPKNVARRADQRYILFSQESPTYLDRNVKEFDGFFNWTMTYQHSADIPYIYGRLVPLPSAPSPQDSQVRKLIEESKDGPNYAKGKNKLVAWFNSHCFTQSRREDYAKTLSKHIKVDVYGRCSNLQCAFNETTYLSSPECYDMLEKHYKFYLSFENALCTDYITEKFFDMLNRRIIPVVLGGADYSAIAPPHSYIDATLYTPKELAEYLKRLASDDRLYNEYFWWKPFFRVESRFPQMANRALCQLCRQLHFNHTVSIYTDLRARFSKDGQCRPSDWKGVAPNKASKSFLGLLMPREKTAS